MTKLILVLSLFFLSSKISFATEESESIEQQPQASVVTEEVKPIEEKPILKIKANDRGECDDIVLYPYVYYGRDRKAEAGVEKLENKKFVRVTFEEDQLKKFLIHLETCRAAHQVFERMMKAYDKDKPLHSALTKIESQLRAGLTSCNLNKASKRSYQDRLFDIIKFKRILKYKYVRMIVEFRDEVKSLASSLETSFVELDEQILVETDKQKEDAN